MGCKILSLSPHLLVQLCQSGTGMVEVEANPLPPDAVIVDATMWFDRDEILLKVMSAEYPDAAEGAYAKADVPRFRDPVAWTEEQERKSRERWAARAMGVTPHPGA